MSETLEADVGKGNGLEVVFGLLDMDTRARWLSGPFRLGARQEALAWCCGDLVASDDVFVGQNLRVKLYADDAVVFGVVRGLRALSKGDDDYSVRGSQRVAVLEIPTDCVRAAATRALAEAGA